MKKLTITFLLALLIAAAVIAPAGAVSARIGASEVRGEVLLVDSTTYVPLREACGLLSPRAVVSWSGGAAAVDAPLVDISARPGELYMEANGRYLFACAGVRLYNGRVYVPIRAIARAFGATVTWDGAAQRAGVNLGSGTIASGGSFYDSDSVYWLSHIISAESSGEPMRGKIAVGNVILNRVASPDYPNSIYGVIFDSHYGAQFEPTTNGTIYQTPTADSVIAAKLCLDGASVVGKCQYFFNPAAASSSWIAQNRTYYCTIGNHLFYA